MKEYQINEKYKLEVVDICNSANGYDYLLCVDEYGTSFRIYNIIKYQYTNVPNSIQAIVKNIDHNGRPILQQDERAELTEHYKLGRFYTFSITDCKSDRNGNQFYVIEDDFARQRWYSDEELEIGDDIILEAKSINNSGYVNYARHTDFQLNETEELSIPSVQMQLYSDCPILEIGDEDERTEFKTTIVFEPKNHTADIDKQMFYIVAELASFMNAKGGTLYIGVHDKTHEILGIEKDFPYLNDGHSPYAGSYPDGIDGYQLKIRNSVVELCGQTAGSLLSIDFPEQESVSYCKVVVEEAKRPIWVKGNLLYQRQGNQKRLITGDSLTFYVGERIGSYIVNMAKESHDGLTANTDVETMIHNAVKAAINDRRTSVAKKQADSSQAQTPKMWVVWQNDRTWKKQRDQETGPCFAQQPICDDVSNLIVVFCYGGGTVNVVKLRDFLKGTTLNNVNKKGFSSKEEPLNIFITHPSNLLFVHSADTGGTEYVKLHHLSDINPKASGGGIGAFIIPKANGHVLDFKLIESAQSANAQSLIVSKKDTSQNFGFNIHDINLQKEINYVFGL